MPLASHCSRASKLAHMRPAEFTRKIYITSIFQLRSVHRTLAGNPALDKRSNSDDFTAAHLGKGGGCTAMTFS